MKKKKELKRLGKDEELTKFKDLLTELKTQKEKCQIMSQDFVIFIDFNLKLIKVKCNTLMIRCLFKSCLDFCVGMGFHKHHVRFHEREYILPTENNGYSHILQRIAKI